MLGVSSPVTHNTIYIQQIFNAISTNPTQTPVDLAVCVTPECVCVTINSLNTP